VPKADQKADKGKKEPKKPTKTAAVPPKGDLTDEELGTVCGGGSTVSSECGCSKKLRQ
jgi:hypothetical protein